MRELLFKNFVSKDRRKTELFLSEHFANNGFAQDLEKRITYRIKEVLEFTDIFDLELFLKQKSAQDTPSHTFIVRNQNSQRGTAKIIYKILGEQYLVVGDRIVIVKVSQHVKKTITKDICAPQGS